MKKILICIICVIAFLPLFGATVCAGEEIIVPATSVETEPGFWDVYKGRIWEYWSKYQSQILEVGCTIAIGVIYLVINGFMSKKINKIQVGTDANTDKLAGENGVIEATNGLIDAYNGMTAETKVVFENLIKGYKDFVAETRVSYEKMLEGVTAENKKLAEEFTKLQKGYADLQAAYERYGETENDRNRVIGVVLAQSAAVLEILQVVYATSSKLPQGVKDLVNLKYAKTLESIKDDPQMLAIVTAVRDNINASGAEEWNEG